MENFKLYMLIGSIIIILILFVLSKSLEKDNSKVIDKDEEKKVTSMTAYSLNDREKYGFDYFDRSPRPSYLIRKGKSIKYEESIDKALEKSKDHKIISENMIPLKELYSDNNYKQCYVRVFVDTIIGDIAIIRDNSAVYRLDLNGFYDVGGEFVIIELKKEGTSVEVTRIIKY